MSGKYDDLPKSRAAEWRKIDLREVFPPEKPLGYQPTTDPKEALPPELRDAVIFKSSQIADKVEEQWGKAGMGQRLISLRTAEKTIIEDLITDDAINALLKEYRASPNYDAKRYASGNGRNDAADTGLPNH